MYIEVADLKAFKNIESSADDVLLEGLIASAQAWIERKCHRIFEVSADTTRYIDTSVYTDGVLLFLDRDLCSIKTVTTNADRSDGGDALTINTHYITKPRNETPYWALKMLSSSPYSWSYVYDPENGVKIEGKWAYSQIPPEPIKTATKQLAAYLYQQRDAQIYDVTAMPEQGMIVIPKGIPRTVLINIAPYIRPIIR